MSRKPSDGESSIKSLYPRNLPTRPAWTIPNGATVVLLDGLLHMLYVERRLRNGEQITVDGKVIEVALLNKGRMEPPSVIRDFLVAQSQRTGQPAEEILERDAWLRWSIRRYDERQRRFCAERQTINAAIARSEGRRK